MFRTVLPMNGKKKIFKATFRATPHATFSYGCLTRSGPDCEKPDKEVAAIFWESVEIALRDNRFYIMLRTI